MTRATWQFGLLAVLLISTPFMGVKADEYDDDEGDSSGGEEKDVVVLTTKNFDEKVKSAKFALVEFYAPWCGHCKSLKPHYAKAATALKASNPDVMLGMVDATVESELGTRFEVQGYPSLKWFVNGELASDYGGGRDAEGIIKWVEKKSGPAFVEADSADAVSLMESSKPVIVLGYFEAKEGDAFEAFTGVAQKIEDVHFVVTLSADVAKEFGVEKDSAVVIKNHAGEERAVVAAKEALSDESLSTLVTGEKLPLTIEFSQDNSDKIFNSGLKKQLLLVAKADDLAEDSETFKAFRATAAEFKGKLVFVTVNSEGESAEPVVNFFGLKDVPSPSVVGFFMDGNKKYKMTEDVTAENLASFASAVLDGTAYVEYKSAPIPEGDDAKDGDVAIVVGKSVESIVFDSTKDVLLEVYAPWCGHCKKLDPIYKKLAKRFKSVSSVVIAKMDGTENEHPDIEAKGYPTILFYPAGDSRKAITFEGGDRSLKALTKFIKKHAKVPYDLPKKNEGAKGSDKDEL